MHCMSSSYYGEIIDSNCGSRSEINEACIIVNQSIKSAAINSFLLLVVMGDDCFAR